MAVSLPGTYAAALYPPKGKSLLLACTYWTLALVNVAQQLRRLFGSVGTAAKTDVLLAAEDGSDDDVSPDLAAQGLVHGPPVMVQRNYIWISASASL